jgi:hypothetical protein
MRFSEKANAVFDSPLWERLNLRSEFRCFAESDWYNDPGRIQGKCERTSAVFMALRSLGLIYFDPPKQRYCRSKLGVEVSDIYS